MDVRESIASLEKEILGHEATHHPFLKRFSTEPLTRQQLQTFGLQHYQLVKVFTTYMTNLLPKFPDKAGGQLLRSIFDDEFGQWTIFRSHAALYRKFLKALGLVDEDWGRVRLLPETSGFIEFHLSLTREATLHEGIGAIGPAHEFSIPTMFAYLLEGLRKNAPLTDEDVEYFTMHIIQDVEHAKIFNDLIVRYTKTEQDWTRIRDGALRSMAMRKRFWDGLKQAVFSPLPAPP